MSEPGFPFDRTFDSKGTDEFSSAAIRWVRERLLRETPLSACENGKTAESSPLVALLRSANLPEQRQKELVF